MTDDPFEEFRLAWMDFEVVAKAQTDRATAEQAINDLETIGELSRRDASQLHGIRQLRNLITHTAGSPIAIPSAEVIDLLLLTTSRLSGRPPTVGGVAFPAWVVSLGDRLDAVLARMQEQDFSQAPIQDGSPLAMFTLEQVTRWLWLTGPRADTSSVTVADVIELGPLSAAGQLKASSPTQRAVDLLVAALDDGHPETVPVLQVGSRRAGGTLQLFTLSDLPRAMRTTRPLRAVPAPA